MVLFAVRLPFRLVEDAHFHKESILLHAFGTKNSALPFRGERNLRDKHNFETFISKCALQQHKVKQF